MVLGRGSLSVLAFAGAVALDELRLPVLLFLLAYCSLMPGLRSPVTVSYTPLAVRTSLSMALRSLLC